MHCDACFLFQAAKILQILHIRKRSDIFLKNKMKFYLFSTDK